MTRVQRRGVLCAASLCCAAVASVTADRLAFTEFGGGQLTGPLVQLCYGGGVLFLAGALLVFPAPRLATVVGLAAAAGSFPLYFYLIAPLSLDWMSQAPSSVAPPRWFTPDAWAIAGMASLGVLVVARFTLAGGARPSDGSRNE